MAISFVSNALGGTTTTTSFSITLPATQANDIIILEYTHRGTTDATLGGTYSGGAFTEKHDQQYATSTFSGKTLWSRATGNHTGQTVTGSGLTNSCAAIITIYRGALTSGDPLADATIVGEQNASADETQAQITTATDGAWVVLVVANSPDVAVSSQASTSPSSLTERAEVLSTGGTDTSIAHASAAKNTAGATGAFTWAQTDGASGSWAYAIKPEPSLALSQAAFRYYADGTESGSTALANQDTNYTADLSSGDVNLALRVRLQETAGSTLGFSTDDYQLQYELNDVGTYVNISDPVSRVDFWDASLAGFASLYNAANAGRAQSVTGTGVPITSIIFELSKTGSPTGSAVAKVYAHSGTFGTSSIPTGAALATSDNFDVSTLTTTSTLTTLVFSGGNQITLTNGTNYVVSLEYTASGDINNRVNITLDIAGHAGNYSSLASGTWTANSGADLLFYINPIYPIIGFNSASLTDGNATTNRLGAGTGSFVAGEISEDGLVDDLQITASNYTELLYSLTIESTAVANNDTLDFRVLRNGATTGMTYTVTPRVTVSVSGGATVTPATASLTTTTFAPIIQHTIPIPTASLTTTTFAPNVILGTILTPTTASLTLTSFEPTVTATQNQLVTPSTVAISTSTFAPTISVSDNKAVTPATASLSLTSFAPTIAVSDNQTATPTTATLSTSTFAPVVTIGVVASPSVASLTTTTFAPTVTATDNKTVVPGTVSLSLTAYAPSVVVNNIATPSTAALTTNAFAPTVSISDNQLITPTTASLSLSTFAPTIAHGYVFTPTTQSLTTSTFAPAVVASDHKIVTPSTSSLTLSTFSPTVTTDNNITVTPNTYSLSTEAFAPTVSATNHQTVTPSTATLSLNNYAPSVTVGSGTEQPRSLLTLGVG